MRSTSFSPFFVSLVLLGLAGCGGTASSAESTTPQRTASRSHGTSGDAPIDPRMHPALDRLHPPESLPLLARVEAGPTDVDAIADAAEAYASTDACGMTIFWGQTYRLLAPEGPRGAALAQAIRRVYETRVTRTVDGSTTHISTRLAPGSTPAIAMPDGALLIPFAHRYEMSIAATSPDSSTFDGVATSIARYAHASNLGVGLASSDTELAAYLRTLDDDLLVAYAHWIVGPAYDAEWTAYRAQHADVVARFATHLASHPFAPSRGVRPDDLIDARRNARR